MQKWQVAMCAFRWTRTVIRRGAGHPLQLKSADRSDRSNEGATLSSTVGSGQDNTVQASRASARAGLRMILARDHDNSDLAAAEP